MSYYNLISIMPKTAPFVGILDLYPNAGTAYSLRKLRSAYSGNCIQVRRSSDNTTQDIGFVNNFLDTTSLLSFVGAGNGFVTTWYDQSGNSRNATQANATFQPRIVSSGNLITTSNGKIAVDCYNSSMGLTVSIPTTTAQATFSVYQNETTLNNSTGWAMPFCTFDNQNTAAIIYMGIIASGSGASPDQNVGTPSYHKNGGTALTRTRGTLFTQFVNGTISLATIMGGSLSNTLSTRFLQYSLGTAFGGNYKLSECIMYYSDQSTNRTGIESNINSFYTIY